MIDGEPNLSDLTAGRASTYKSQRWILAFQSWIGALHLTIRTRPGLLTHDLVIAHHVTLNCPYAGCAEYCSS